MTTLDHAAVRDDLERAIERGRQEHKSSRAIANHAVHLLVLHGLLPEVGSKQ